jgi:hypothetical protein
LSLLAQVEKIAVPVPQDEFETFLEKMQLEAIPSEKVNFALVLADTKNFTCRQIRELTNMLQTDNLKYQFAIKAYQRAVNPSDYFEIMDAFELKSTAFRFYDAINSRNPIETVDAATEYDMDDAPVKFQTPITFPDANQYSGETPKHCPNPITEKQFAMLLNKVRKIENPQEQLKTAQSFVENYCFSVSQLMKLGLFVEDESIRFDIFSFAQEHVYDRNHFVLTQQVFENSYYRNKIIELCSGKEVIQIKPVEIQKLPENDCAISERDMNEIIAVLNDEKFENNRKSTAQLIIKRKRCFRTEQIIRILMSFEFENTKLEMAKYAFPYVVDKSNYFTVLDIFEFSANKTDLQEFLEQQE